MILHPLRPNMIPLLQSCKGLPPKGLIVEKESRNIEEAGRTISILCPIFRNQLCIIIQWCKNNFCFIFVHRVQKQNLPTRPSMFYLVKNPKPPPKWCFCISLGILAKDPYNIDGSDGTCNQGCHSRFLPGKTARVAATSQACRYLVLYHKIQTGQIQGVSSQTVISNLALLRIQLLIFADILGPTCS